MEEQQDIYVDFSVHGDVTVAAITKSKMLDATNSRRFGGQVLAYLDTHPDIQLVVDFTKVKYMSSAGLTELLRINETLQKWGATVHLWGLNCDIRNVFCITHLDKLFKLVQADSLAEAIQHCCDSASGSEH